jgi:hypothetical protein
MSTSTYFIPSQALCITLESTKEKWEREGGGDIAYSEIDRYVKREGEI